MRSTRGSRAGAHFTGTQISSLAGSSAIRVMRMLWPSRAIAQHTALCESIAAMAERRFIILRYVGKVPAMASCTKCRRKFFTPNTVAHDAVRAYEYLWHKLDLHECAGEPKTVG
ncbi:MAG: hypothetical protein WBQ08_09830 [Candidatus Sulfotelmatobacter sp.]